MKQKISNISITSAPPPPIFRLNSNKAFTLIELLVVVLIIGILASVALPQYTKTVEISKVSEARIILKALADASHAYTLETGKKISAAPASTRWDLLNIDIPLPNALCPSSINGGKQGKYFIYQVDPSNPIVRAYRASCATGKLSAIQYDLLLYTETSSYGPPNTLVCGTRNTATGKFICKNLGGKFHASDKYVVPN